MSQVDSYEALGTDEDPDVATTTLSHGEPPSPVPGMKREPGTPGEIQHVMKTRRLTSLNKADRCCNCSTRSTCSTKLCACRSAGRHCIDCVCISKCFNTVTLPASSKSIQDEKVRGSPDNAVTPRNLNFQKDGEDDATDMSNDDARDAEPLTPEKPSLEEEEEVQETPIGDLPGAAITELDLKMKEVLWRLRSSK